MYIALFLKELIEDEKQKKNDKDSMEWKLLLDKIITKISSSEMEVYSFIKNKKIALKQLLEIHEKEILNNRITHWKKTIVGFNNGTFV